MANREVLREGTTRSKKTYYYFTEFELESFKFRLAKRFLSFTFKLCMVDRDSIHTSIRSWWRNGRTSQRPDMGKFQAGQWTDNESTATGTAGQRRTNIWPIVVLIYYVIVSLEIMLLFSLQYKFDVYWVRLTRLRESLNMTMNYVVGNSDFPICQSVGPGNELCHKEIRYQKLVDLYYHDMKLIGNRHVYMTFTTQHGLLCMIGIVYISYLHAQVATYFGLNVEMFLIKLILDESSEYNECRAIVKRETRLVEQSSLNYVKAVTEYAQQRLEGLVQRTGMVLQADPLMRGNAQQVHDTGPVQHLNIIEQVSNMKYALAWQSEQLLACTRRDHLLVRRQLKLLMSTRELHPINRTSAEWRNQLLSNYLLFSLSIMAYGVLVIIFFFYIAPPLMSVRPLDCTTTMDTVIMIEVWFYCHISAVAIAHYLPLFAVHCHNQTRYINHLMGRIRSVIKENERDFCEMLQQGCPSDQCRERMNLKLVQVFLEYRILLGQLKPFIKTWAQVVNVGLISMFIGPVLTILYNPYTTKVHNLVMTLFAIDATIIADLLIVPVCNFEFKGQQLYRVLSSLLAHAIELDQQSRDLLGASHDQGCIYMVNTIELIRKELSDPDQLMDKFCTKTLGFKTTFPKLVELHFYISVLNMALFFKIDFWKNILGERLKDPLFLFDDSYY